MRSEGGEEGTAIQGMHDLLVIGGGINGAAIARDAAGRGLSVLLVEREDAAQHTSSASTKLIHGGLRYLETYEFRLVREALHERAVMLATAPHLVTPLRFILPHAATLRPAWMISAGLFLYDHLGGRGSLPGSAQVRLDAGSLASLLKPGYARGFEYSDAWVDDSRLVAVNLLDAAEHGADVRTRTPLVAAERGSDGWRATIESGGVQADVRARAIVNAAGPWVGETLTGPLHAAEHRTMRLVKGSHIIVDRLYDDDRAFILQNDDRRIVFVIPYQRDFTLIGTTDIPWDGAPGTPRLTAEEARYLCDAVGVYLRRPITPADIRHSYSGIRPLYDDAATSAFTVTRDYLLDLDARDGEAPLLSVYGGKITTARRLAEHALEKLGPVLGTRAHAWTKRSPLPGGDLGAEGLAGFIDRSRRRWPGLPHDMLDRMAHAYGSRMERVLGDARSMSDLGMHFGAGLTASEVDYLARVEWARTADDVLWRRSKLGMRLDAEGVAAVEDHLRVVLGSVPRPDPVRAG